MPIGSSQTEYITKLLQKDIYEILIEIGNINTISTDEILLQLFSRVKSLDYRESIKEFD